MIFGSNKKSAGAKTSALLSRRIVAFLLIMSLVVASALMLPSCSNTENEIPSLKSPVISAPTIADDGKLRVGVDASNSPLAGKNGDRIIGIDVDIAAALSDELGLALEVVDVGKNGAKAISDNTVDVVLGVESATDEEDCWLSNQYLQTGIVLFSKAGSNSKVPTQASAPKIAAQVSSKSAWAVTNIFGDDSLAAATDLTAAFKNLDSGEVDYVASDAIIGLYAANRQGIEVDICALLESPTGYCAMVSSENTNLQDAISNALSTIKDNGVIGVIENKWIGQDIDLAGVSKIEGKKAQTSNVKDDEGEDAQAENSTTSSSSSSSSSSASNLGAAPSNSSSKNQAV